MWTTVVADSSMSVKGLDVSPMCGSSETVSVEEAAVDRPDPAVEGMEWVVASSASVGGAYTDCTTVTIKEMIGLELDY